MKSTRPLSRLAGLLYVLISIPGFYGLIYVPSRIIVHGDPAATARHIMAAEALFRSGVVANLVSQTLFILVAFTLHRLLRGVNATAAALMVVLLVVSIPITFVAEVHHLVVPKLLDPNGPAAAFDESQRIALMSQALDAYRNGILVTEIFWGLWLFPLAWLVYRSGFLPRFLGVLLVIAGCAYLAECLTALLAPAAAARVEMIAGPLRALELVAPLWLLIVGAKDVPLPA